MVFGINGDFEVDSKWERSLGRQWMISLIKLTGSPVWYRRNQVGLKKGDWEESFSKSEKSQSMRITL